MMTHRRIASIALVVGCLLAIGAPVHSRTTDEAARFYLPAGAVWLQAIPFVLCAVLWLPWSSVTAARGAPAVALLLLGWTALWTVPMLSGFRVLSGDMQILGFMLLWLTGCAVVLLSSPLVLLWARRWPSDLLQESACTSRPD